jgi:VWFA-related protein
MERVLPTMRTLLAGLTVLGLLAAPAGHAQETPASGQRFRSGIDLITIDVSAVDRDGRPVEDLRPRDLRVKIDGREREIVSVELVKVDTSRAGEPPPVEAPLISANLIPDQGRRLVVAVDQTLIRPGSAALLIRTAGEFVAGLTPDDYAALLAFPEPGPREDFTKDRARVQEAIGRVVGQPAKQGFREFNIQTWEALALDLESLSICIARPDCGDPPRLTPVMQRVLERGCRGVPFSDFYPIPADSDQRAFLDDCQRAVQQESATMRLEIRQDANLSVRRLESYLKELANVEGPKTMVLVSAGLVMEDLTLLNEVERLAAAARTTVHVVAVEPERDQEIRGLDNSQSTMSLQDRSWELGGLEEVADRTGGELFRAIGAATGVFERLATQTSAWYVVAVERQPDDPAEQRVEVEGRRRGVTVRASRTAVATEIVNAGRPPADVLRDALSSPIAVSGIPLRLSSFVQREIDDAQYRLHLTAQIGQPGEPGGEYAVGYVVMSEEGQVVASLGRQLPLVPGSAGDAQPLPFDTALRIGPGRYSVRFGVVDGQGRRGTVVRDVTLDPLASDGVATSDLIVGSVPEDGEAMHPGVEPYVEGGRVAGYLEVYLPEADAGDLSVRLEVAEGDNAPALSTQMLNVGPGSAPARRVASGAVTADLLPGRYVARATVLRADEPLRVVARPFVLAPHEGPSPDPVARGEPMSPELQQRTASYVGTVVGGLANVVAEEDFTLTDPDRQVVSDFLLVRYPGSERDFLTFRDVVSVDGRAVEGRAQRREELFLEPIGLIQVRVREINSAAGEHVPPVLNPMFGLAFLQADFQGRFALTVREAGEGWPAQVTAVSFEETARPTLLRGGLRADQDVPTRGTAWIETGTGRLLQTELQLGDDRRAPRITTRYRLDSTLQIMVPEQMRTENPRGVATYRNFRRFRVGTDTVFQEDEP